MSCETTRRHSGLWSDLVSVHDHDLLCILQCKRTPTWSWYWFTQDPVIRLGGSGSLTQSVNFRLCSFKNALWIMSQSKMRTKLNVKCNQITVRLTTAGSRSLQDPSVTDMFPWVWLNTTHERVMYLKLILPCRETGRQLQIVFWADNNSANDWKSTHLHENYFKKHKK